MVDESQAVIPESLRIKNMLRNKRMDNPFWKDNENKAVELMEEDYEYVCHFNCPEEMLAKDRRALAF